MSDRSEFLTDLSFRKAHKPHLGDNCIQNFHMGRYIVGYTVGSFVLRRPVRGAVKHNFRSYILLNFHNENFEYLVIVTLRCSVTYVLLLKMLLSYLNKILGQINYISS